MDTPPAPRPRAAHPATSRRRVVAAPTDGSPDPTPERAASLDARRRLGADGEGLAADHLVAEGWDIVQRNWRLSSGEVRGELDLIAVRDGVLAIVEVKTRRSDRFGGAAAAVTRSKQERIRALGLAFLRSIGGSSLRLRFDVVTVTFPSGATPVVTHHPGAF